MTSGGGKGGGAGAKDKVSPPSAAAIASAFVGAGISGSLAGLEPPSISSGGLSGIDGSCGRGCVCRIDGALGTAGLSVCAGKARSEVPAPVDALAGGMCAASAAIALSGTTPAPVVLHSATAELSVSTAAEEAEAGTRPCLGTGRIPYFDGKYSAM